jgi:hypothetical protein
MKIVVFLTALLLPGLLLAQERTALSTAQSDQTYAVGTHEQDVPTPKPLGMNMARLVVDRSELQFLPSTTRIDFELYQTLDGGITWQFLGGGGRGGGVSAPFPAGSNNEPRTTSSLTQGVSPEEGMLKSVIRITGEAYRTNAVVQMWEVQ